MLTPDDIRNPSRESGYDYVNGAQGPGRRPSWRASRVSAQGNHSNGRATPKWRGPARPTPLAAAWDYCHFMNGNGSRIVHKPLKTAGHKIRRNPGKQVPAEVAAAYGTIRDYRARERAVAPNYVYLIAEWGGEYVKVGESAKPPARPAELQTGNARTLVLVAYYKVDQLKGADKAVHQLLATHHEQNEWFHPTDAVLSHFNVTREDFDKSCGVPKTVKEAS